MKQLRNIYGRKKAFAIITAICLLCGIIPMMGVFERGNGLRSYAASSDKKLAVPVEFKKVSDEKAWDKSRTDVGMEYTENLHTLSSKMTLSYDVYIPKSLWTSESTNMYIGGGIDFIDVNNDDQWIGGANSSIGNIFISKNSKGYIPRYWNGKKTVSAKKYATVKTTGKYVLVCMKNVPIEKKGYTMEGVLRCGQRWKRSGSLSE